MYEKDVPQPVLVLVLGSSAENESLFSEKKVQIK